MKRVAALLLAVAAGAAHAETLEPARYLSKYPGLYTQFGLAYDARDRVFDESGARIDSVAPTYGAGGAFPQWRFDANLDWHFPLFEADGLPLISDRLWNARASLGYARESARGAVADYADANGLEGAKSGLGDLDLAFGPVLYGARDWRARDYTPLSVILLAEARLPIGSRSADAASNAGANVYAWGARLGADWQPRGALLGWRLDAGLRWRAYGRNQEPAFGGQEPAQPGADWMADATLARRLWRGIEAQVSYAMRHGAANEYSQVRFAAQPPAATPGMDSFPDPGRFRDGGTREQRLQAGVSAFLTQRLRLAFSYEHPLSGRSGGFDLPYLQQPQDCGGLNPLAPCITQPNGSAHVDGLGSARSFASDVWMLSLDWAPAASRGP